MLCKFCKTNTIVADGVDNRASDETYRLRVCPKCNHIFYTVEFPVMADKMFAKEWRDHHKRHRKIINDTYVSPELIKKLVKKSHKKVYRRKEKK